MLPADGGLELADFRAGGDVITTELSYLTSRKQLEQATGIDAQAKLGLGPLSGSASFGLNHSFAPASRTVLVHVVPMNASIEMKLASGMTAAHRGQDLVDVMALVKARSLPREHAEQLDPSVRPAYEHQWALAQHDDDY